MSKEKIQNYINHIVFVIDRSGSMSSLSNETVTVFDNQIKYLASRSKELNQETRVSVYLFGSRIDCLIYDMDVMRLPSLKDHYEIEGMTALLDGTGKAIEDLKKTPELYGDHSFLIYVLTDGGENKSRKYDAAKMSETIRNLADNWTLAVMVPNIQGVAEAKRFGFPTNNIMQWSTDAAGIGEVGEVLTKTTNNFMQGRAKGVRGTKNLFNMNTNVSTTTIKKNLEVLNAGLYETLIVRQYDDGKAIKDFVESWMKVPYRVGSAYYQLSKPEKIQAAKNIIVRNKKDAKAYTGDNARNLLGLPNYEVKVSPATIKDYDVFVQSTSVNRKLVRDTHLLVMK